MPSAIPLPQKFNDEPQPEISVVKTPEKEKQETLFSALAETKSNIKFVSQEIEKNNRKITASAENDQSLDSTDRTEIKQAVETAQKSTREVIQEAEDKISQLEVQIQSAKEGGEVIKAAGLKKEKEYWQSKIEIAKEKEKLAALPKPEGKKAQKIERKIRQQEIQQKIFETKTDKEKSTEQKQQEIQDLKMAAEREKTFGQKLAELFTNKEVAKRFVMGQVNALASILGVRTIYSLPAWIWQRANVKGEFGRTGLQKQLEKTLEASKARKAKTAEAKEGKISQKQEMAELMKIVKMTKKGGEKRSVLRNELARIIKENRRENRNLDEEEQAEVQKLVKRYGETKINGLEAARDGLNSVCVATGAFQLRIATRGLFDVVLRYQRLKQTAGEGKKVNIIKDVIAGGIAETFQKAAFVSGKGKTMGQRGIEFAQAASTLASYFGMGAMSFQPERLGADIGKLLEATRGEMSISKIGENIFQNAVITKDRYKDLFTGRTFKRLAEGAGRSIDWLLGGGVAEAAEPMAGGTAAGAITPGVGRQPSAINIEHFTKGKNAEVAELFSTINENPENPDFINTHDKIFPGNEAVLTYEDGSQETITVKEGDNLWNIAKGHTPSKISEIELRQGTAERPPEDLRQSSPKPRPTVPPSAGPAENIQPEETLKPRETPSPVKTTITEPVKPASSEIPTQTTAPQIIEPQIPKEKPVEDLGKIETSPPKPKPRWQSDIGAFVQDEPPVKEPIIPAKKPVVSDLTHKPIPEKSRDEILSEVKDLDGKPALEKRGVVSDLTHKPVIEKSPSAFPVPEGEYPVVEKSLGINQDVLNNIDEKAFEELANQMPGLDKSSDIITEYQKLLQRPKEKQTAEVFAPIKGFIVSEGQNVMELITDDLQKNYNFPKDSIHNLDQTKDFIEKNLKTADAPKRVAFFYLLDNYHKIDNLRRTFLIERGGRVEVSPGR